MRQGQQNRRGRGRNNNNNNNQQNRKGPEPVDAELREHRAGRQDTRHARSYCREVHDAGARCAVERRSGSRRELSAARRALQPHHHGLPRTADCPGRRRCGERRRHGAPTFRRLRRSDDVGRLSRTTTATIWAATCTSSSRPSRVVMSHSRCSRGRTRVSGLTIAVRVRVTISSTASRIIVIVSATAAASSAGFPTGTTDRPDRQDRPERFQRPERVQRARSGPRGRRAAACPQ